MPIAIGKLILEMLAGMGLSAAGSAAVSRLLGPMFARKAATQVASTGVGKALNRLLSSARHGVAPAAMRGYIPSARGVVESGLKTAGTLGHLGLFMGGSELARGALEGEQRPEANIWDWTALHGLPTDMIDQRAQMQDYIDERAVAKALESLLQSQQPARRII